MATAAIDRSTGRPYGDHGRAEDAINFAIDQLGMEGEEQDPFLRAWREGALEDWPEFYTWLKDRGL